MLSILQAPCRGQRPFWLFCPGSGTRCLTEAFLKAHSLLLTSVFDAVQPQAEPSGALELQAGLEAYEANKQETAAASAAASRLSAAFQREQVSLHCAQGRLCLQYSSSC